MADLAAAYFFHGDDEIKIAQARRRLAERAEREGASLEAFSADSASPEAVAGALLSPSLLPGRRIVLVEAVEAWKAADVGPAADAIAALGTEGLDATVVLVSRKKPLKAFEAALEAVGGELREFKAPSERELPHWVVAQAKQLGCAIDDDAAALLVALVGQPGKRVSASQKWSPMRRLRSELEKLASAAGGQQIDQQLVAQQIHGESSAEVFALTDHALAGARADAIADAEQLLASGEAPPRIVAMLARSFGQAQAVAALSESGRGGEVAEALGIQPWLAKKLAGQASGRGGASIRAALIELARLDAAVKGASALDPTTELLRSVGAITR